MAVAGVYKRILPCPPAIEFASQDGKVLFAEALRDGTMNGFFQLIGTFQTQAEPAYCGLSTLAVVLNALSIDPGRKWKGPWRWFDESMLDCCEPLEKVKKDGITFGKVTCLALCAGASVQAFRANETSLDAFRALVENCVSSDDHHMIISYDRRPLKQTGTGHFSPLGGYHRQRDLALILDVARFKYPPHWVPLPLLWEAINTIDGATGKARGFMMVYKRESPSCFLFTLSCKDERWRAMCKYLLEEVPRRLKLRKFTSTKAVIDTVFDSLPAEVTSFVKWIVEVKLAEEGASKFIDGAEIERLHYKSKVLQQLQQTKAFELVTEWMKIRSNCSSTLADDSLQNLITQACCQGAAAFTGVKCLSNITCTKEQIEAHVASHEGKDGAVLVTSKVLVDGREHQIDALVSKASSMPASTSDMGPCRCSLENATFHPTTLDLLSVLLLALPSSIWEEISNLEIHSEMCRVVSREKLPCELRLEVEHLLEQAVLVTRSCSEEENSNRVLTA